MVLTDAFTLCWILPIEHTQCSHSVHRVYTYCVYAECVLLDNKKRQHMQEQHQVISEAHLTCIIPTNVLPYYHGNCVRLIPLQPCTLYSVLPRFAIFTLSRVEVIWSGMTCGRTCTVCVCTAVYSSGVLAFLLLLRGSNSGPQPFINISVV